MRTISLPLFSFIVSISLISIFFLIRKTGRLLLAAQQAQDLAKEVSPDTAAKNPQLFADQISDLAGHADGLSNYIADQSKGFIFSKMNK